MDKKTFYITTAIDYVNDTIHVGHAFQKILADVLARYKRVELGKENVFFLTGTDEYGQKAEKAANESRISPQEYVSKISNSDEEQQKALNISFDRFIRTTDKDHGAVAQEIWKRVEAKGDIYLGEFTGLYCTGCEAYYTKEELVIGKCQLHPSLTIKEITEKNYFFKWSNYKNQLIDYIKSNPDFIYPSHRANEMLEFAKDIRDIPISRTSFSWGVPVPGKEGHVMYVWFDALTNYLTGVGFNSNETQFDKFWPADVHVLGKDNLRWHALLWPAMLMSADLEIPTTILVNGFLNLDGQKISKSLGNVIRPADWVEKFGVDTVRYYLLRYTSATEDSDISEAKLIAAYNADLANGLGNLVARVAKLCENINFKATSSVTAFDPKMEAFLKDYQFNLALEHIWGEIRNADKFVNEQKPWEQEGEILEKTLQTLVEKIQHIGYNLQPFLPETSEKILSQFSGEIKSGSPLFPRIS